MKTLRDTLAALTLLTSVPFMAWFYGMDWPMTHDFRPGVSAFFSILFLFVTFVIHLEIGE